MIVTPTLLPYRTVTPFGELRAALVPPFAALAFCGPLLPRKGQPPVAATVTVDEIAARVTSVQLVRAWGPDRWVPAPPSVHDHLAEPVSTAVDTYLTGPGRTLIRNRLDALLANLDTTLVEDPTPTVMAEQRTAVLLAAIGYDTTDPAVAEVAAGLADGWQASITDLIDAATAIVYTGRTT